MNLIIDRTLQDVNHWKALHKKGWAGMNDTERTEWLSAMKGCYGITDMNRVEAAVEVLSERLRELGYLHPTLTTKTNWSASDVPTKVDFDRYFSNVEALRKAIALGPSTPETPTTKVNLDFQRANDLEEILLNIDKATTNLQKTWFYAGDIFAGEV